MFHIWLSNLKKRLFGGSGKKSKGRRAARPAPTFRPQLELLEDRFVPTTISYTTAGSNYTQNFSTLPDNGGTASIATGSGSPVQGPYDLSSSTGGAFGASGLTGWYAANLASTAELFGQGQPSTTTGALFDFNNGTAGSQSLGTISTGTTSSRFGAIFTNNTGETLNQFTLSYTGEEWWANSGTGTSLNFAYETGPSLTLPTTGTAGITVSQLGFTGPTSGSGTYENGTQAANQVAVSDTVTGIDWAPGQTLVIFWDKGAAGASKSDGLGVANVNFSAAAGPTVTPSTANLAANATTLTISGTNFDTTAANDSVTFSNGVTGTVSAATTTSLTVTGLSGLSGLSAGTALNASVSADGLTSGSAVQVANIIAAITAPTVTSSTANLPANQTSLIISGTGFDTTASNDSVTFSNGVTGSVTSATTTSLTVTSLTGVSGLSVGTALDASVTVDGVSSGSAVQVATISAAVTAPTVTSSTASLAANATSMTISGTSFDTTAANDSVSFSGGVTGSVTSATSTTLTVSLTGLSVLTGGTALNASVTVDGLTSGSAVQVATLAPVITFNTASLAANATSITLSGLGFDTTAAHDSVSFSNGVTGSVTAVTTTSLTVTNLTGVSGLSVGTALNASVTVDGISSGSPVQVASIIAAITAPTVTSSTANLPANATSLIITGAGFDATATNDSVTFSNGVTGSVTSATTTSLTVSSLTGLSSLSVGTVLNASVTVDGISSGSAVQVATVSGPTIFYTTAGSSYTQNFSTLPDAGGTATITTGTGSPVQGPYDLSSSTGGAFGASGLSGWYGANIATTIAAEKFGQGEPSTTTGALFDFNNGNAGSQALGTISTSSATSRFGAIFTNTSGVTLNQFTLSYTGEEWWANSGTGTSLGFAYEIGTSALPTGTTGYTTVSQLGFTGPVVSGTST